MKMFRYLIKFGIRPAGTYDIIVIKSFIYTQTLADLVKTRAQNNLLNCLEHESKQRGVRRLLGCWGTDGLDYSLPRWNSFVCMQQPPISGPSCVDQSPSFPLPENWARRDIPDETLDRIGRYLD